MLVTQGPRMGLDAGVYVAAAQVAIPIVSKITDKIFGNDQQALQMALLKQQEEQRQATQKWLIAGGLIAAAGVAAVLLR